TLRLSNGASVALTAAVALTGTAIVCWYTKDAAALDAFDFWIATFMPFVVVFLQTALAAWVWGADNMIAELDRGAKARVPRSFGWVIKYLTTPYLALVFAFWCFKNGSARLAGVAENPVELKVVLFLAATCAVLLALTIRASKRWRVEEEAAQDRDAKDVSA
ncbi:MAG: hypothetical protein IKY61_02150, partial [Thermoguttaceae bacterium]|nr:hypothetical protein [Thermoguttaceae bacterium]